MPRRKITRAVSDLPKLTQKQLTFCAGILSGKTQREAYKAAYDVKAMTDAMVDCDASRLRNSPKIALWLDAAKTEALAAHVCTVEDHLKELARLKAIAIRTGNVGAAVQAEHLRGKVAGHYVEQYANVTPPDPVRSLRKIAEKTPELARALAQIHGIEFELERVH